MQPLIDDENDYARQTITDDQLNLQPSVIMKAEQDSPEFKFGIPNPDAKLLFYSSTQ